jgi:hypothetical protein
MATDIGGLFMTPEQYQLAQSQAQQAQALQYAQANPQTQAQYGFYRGGQLLGNAIGGALGGQDPQLRMIAQRQAIGSRIDFADPESIMSGANLAAKAGDQALAMHLVDVANKVESTSSQTALRKAQAQKALNWQQTQTDSAQKRASISTLEEKLASDPTYKPSAQEISQARWILANESKTKTQIDPTTGQLYIIEGLNINDAAPNLAQYLKSIGVTAPVPTAETPTTTGAQAMPVSTPTVQASTIQPAGTQQAPVTITKGVTAVPTEASKIKAKEEADKQAAKIEEDTRAAETLVSGVDNIRSVRNLIEETRNLVKPTTTGVLGKVFSIGSTEARSLENKNRQIQSNAVFEELAKLKSQSKTGATGFGALNLEELRTIQNKAGALDPMSPDYQRDLQKIDDYFAKIENTLSAKSSRAQESLGAKPSPTPVSQAKEAQIKAMVDRAMADPRTKGTRAQVESVIRSKMQ